MEGMDKETPPLPNQTEMTQMLKIEEMDTETPPRPNQTEMTKKKKLLLLLSVGLVLLLGIGVGVGVTIWHGNKNVPDVVKTCPEGYQGNDCTVVKTCPEGYQGNDCTECDFEFLVQNRTCKGTFLLRFYIETSIGIGNTEVTERFSIFSLL